MSKEFGSGSSQACASCKHQRKKCEETCELAPFFPASRYREFQNAHKLFGVSNIQKIINSVDPSQRKAAAESILIEGNIRSNDPVHGCLGVVRNLKSQIEYYEKELGAVNQQLPFFRDKEKQHQHQLEKFIKSSSPTLPDIGDMKIGERMYNYQSTMEESEDVRPFDIQTTDPIMNPYQVAHALAAQFGNSNAAPRASRKQPLEFGSDEEEESVDVSSLKGKKI
ncbi:LOB domain-containing protein 22 [Citrus sinensis]|uniref:LOB domain-containing protein 22 n=1 Tax=Citrus sinensis TaxID=2711 RepID=A0ACB8NVM2_CITSI|nr:LOB domain-containing protein 22 [Citrus sinensis]